MGAAEWEKLKEVFALAAEQPRERRPVFLGEACAGDAALRAEVESLLAAADEPDHLIERDDYAAANVFAAEEAGEAGRMFGPYRVIRELGRGGMGAVYLAARADDEYQKQVAVKVIRRGLDTDDVRRRFRNERQILARLEHPNIARLIDGGTTEDGLSYFVMEYVEGLALDEYADARGLSTRARLELFRTVCAAVSYAHRNLVIHRDLKPSNILVTAEGVPKLLDFGIAKFLHGDSDAEGDARTMTGLRALTPEYASPEQVLGLPVTTAADVYSLGVVLYELLTGRRPYRVKSRRPDELARVICEQEPTRPSDCGLRVAGCGVEDKDNASPNPQPATRNPQSLRGDLDNIVLMAMRKEPQRRYASVGQFSEDIRRHLEGRPVLAHKDTFKYRAGKFVRRNRLGVAAGALVALSLVGGIVSTAWQARRATREARTAAEQRDRARVEAAKAERINAFLQNMLSYADPSWYSPGGGRGGEVKVIDALNEAAGRIDAELAEQPEVAAELHHTVGNTYRALGRFDRSESHFRAALELSRKVYGERHPLVARDLYYLGAVKTYNGDSASAVALYQQAVEMFRATDAGNVNLPYLLQDLAGLLLTAEGDAAAAESLLREAMELFRSRHGDEHVMVALTFERLGAVYEARGDLARAEAMSRECVERHRRLSNQQLLPGALKALAALKLTRGEHAEAEPLLREALELALRFVGPNHLSVANILSDLSEAQLLKGDYDAAAESAARALEIQRRVLPEGHVGVFAALGHLCAALARGRYPARAEPHLREALALYEKTGGRSSTHALYAAPLGESLTALGRYAEAEPLLAAHYEFYKARSGDGHPKTRGALARLVRLYEAWGQPERAARLRALSPQP